MDQQTAPIVPRTLAAIGTSMIETDGVTERGNLFNRGMKRMRGGRDVDGVFMAC